MIMRYFSTLLLALLLVAGCGQKGPLYLPGNPSAIKTDTPPQDERQAEEDEDQEDESSETNQIS